MNGNYMYPNGIVITKTQLTEMNFIPNCIANDAKFVANLLLIVFGANELKKMSVTGFSRSKESTEKMDPLKKSFIQGDISIHH
jgi:hypothetical protein